jgi:hypothetical protein
MRLRYCQEDKSSPVLCQVLAWDKGLMSLNRSAGRLELDAFQISPPRRGMISRLGPVLMRTRNPVLTTLLVVCPLTCRANSSDTMELTSGIENYYGGQDWSYGESSLRRTLAWLKMSILLHLVLLVHDLRCHCLVLTCFIF